MHRKHAQFTGSVDLKILAERTQDDVEICGHSATMANQRLDILIQDMAALRAEIAQLWVELLRPRAAYPCPGTPHRHESSFCRLQLHAAPASTAAKACGQARTTETPFPQRV